MDKQTLRHQLHAARAALTPAEIESASEAVCRHLAAWPIFQDANTIFAYLAFRNEISLQPLIDAHPDKVWGLPCSLPGGRMVIRAYQPGQLKRHRFGMMEPAADAPLIPLETIELVLAPGVGFDRQGGRIGWGGGYYDRLLPQLDAIRVGIAHPVCVVPEVPCDESDCRMGYLALPDGLCPVALNPPPPLAG